MSGRLFQTSEFTHNSATPKTSYYTRCNRFDWHGWLIILYISTNLAASVNVSCPRAVCSGKEASHQSCMFKRLKTSTSLSWNRGEHGWVNQPSLKAVCTILLTVMLFMTMCNIQYFMRHLSLSKINPFIICSARLRNTLKTKENDLNGFHRICIRARG